MKSIRKCPKCGEYSLKEECPKCNAKTESSHPPAYSFEKEKKFARFRRGKNQGENN